MRLGSNGNPDSAASAVNYYYTVNGHRSSTQYPDGSANNTFPNALGEPTRAGNWVTGVGYHPNGAVSGFTYGDGHVYSLTQNIRQLPSQRIESKPGSTLMNYSYGYDRNGNLSDLIDNRPTGNENRSMAYDGLNRLVEAHAVDVLGPEFFVYDALDNLRQV